MDIVTLAMAKAYTDSQRLGHVESKQITYDGNGEKKDSLIEGLSVVKISDTLLDLSTVRRVVMKYHDGMEYVIGKENLVALEESGVMILAGYGEKPLVLSAQKNNGAGLPDGLYVVDAVDENGESYHVSLIETETIVPIDPKYLPGVCLPVVELNIDALIGEAAFTDAENAALTACIGMPFILKSGNSTVSTSMVMEYNGGGNEHIFSNGNTTFHTNNGGETWTVINA